MVSTDYRIAKIKISFHIYYTGRKQAFPFSSKAFFAPSSIMILPQVRRVKAIQYFLAFRRSAIGRNRVPISFPAMISVRTFFFLPGAIMHRIPMAVTFLLPEFYFSFHLFRPTMFHQLRRPRYPRKFINNPYQFSFLETVGLQS